MNDYTNYMPISHTPTSVKLLFFTFVILNYVFYKKFKLTRYLEEHFSSHYLTFGSLLFVLFGAFVFPTYDKDPFLATFSVVLGIGMSLSYLYNILQDASQKPNLKQWMHIALLLLGDTVFFFKMSDKTVAYIIILIQNLIIMLYEQRKKKLG